MVSRSVSLPTTNLYPMTPRCLVPVHGALSEGYEVLVGDDSPDTGVAAGRTSNAVRADHVSVRIAFLHADADVHPDALNRMR